MKPNSNPTAVSMRRPAPKISCPNSSSARRRSRAASSSPKRRARPIGWAVCYVNQHDTFVRVEERPYGYVSELFVEEAARGRHVGRKLLNACEDYFRTLKVATVLIGALSANTRAVKAYKAAGYADYDVNLRKVL